jgi:predicted phage terminase large subunit-like protein
LQKREGKSQSPKPYVPLYDYLKEAWQYIDPAYDLIIPKGDDQNNHLRAICEHLEAVIRGDIRRLVINIPPGCAKSNIVSVGFPSWVWSFWPGWRAIFSSYASDLAERDSIRTREVIESEWYQENFVKGQWELVRDSNRKDYFKNSASGFRMATSVGAKVTGYRGNCVIVDDPLNAKDARSDAARKNAIEWWDRAMSSRLNDKRTDAMIIIMQRLHEGDLTGHVLKRGGYEHLCIPSEYEPKRKFVTYLRPLNRETKEPGEPVKFWEDWRTEPGELLFPELFPEHVLDEIRKTELMEDGYAGQHQQRPAPAEGNLFKKAHWRFWKPDGTAPDHTHTRPDGCYQGPARPLPKMEQYLISLDAAFKDGAKNDYVCFGVIGTHKADKFVLERIKVKASFTRTVEIFKDLVGRWPLALRKLVEDKANGTAVINVLQSEIPGIIGVEPEGGKESRAAAIQPQVESGNVYLPDGAPWLDDWVTEFGNFPNGAHDDSVDMLSQVLIYLSNSPAVTRAIAMSKM